MSVASVEIESVVSVLVTLFVLALLVERVAEVLSRPIWPGVQRLFPAEPSSRDRVVRDAWAIRYRDDEARRGEFDRTNARGRSEAFQAVMADPATPAELRRAAVAATKSRRKAHFQIVALVLGILIAFALQVRVFEALGFSGGGDDLGDDTDATETVLVPLDRTYVVATGNGEGPAIAIAPSSLGAPTDAEREKNPWDAFTDSWPTIVDTIFTGLLIGGGSDPIHQMIRGLQQRRNPEDDEQA